MKLLLHFCHQNSTHEGLLWPILVKKTHRQGILGNIVEPTKLTYYKVTRVSKEKLCLELGETGASSNLNWWPQKQTSKGLKDLWWWESRFLDSSASKGAIVTVCWFRSVYLSREICYKEVAHQVMESESPKICSVSQRAIPGKPVGVVPDWWLAGSRPRSSQCFSSSQKAGKQPASYLIGHQAGGISSYSGYG